MDHRTGVLVIAHGSRNPKWVRGIEEAISQICLDLPIEIGFLELVAGRSIEDGIRVLENKGLKRILVVPLFITMGSTHLNEIQYALGLLSEPSIPTDLKPIGPKAEIVWCTPFEAHPLVLDILKERASSLSDNPAQEALLLVAHGSQATGFRERWQRLLAHLALGLKSALGFKAVSYATLHEDEIRRKAKALSKKSKLIVLPVFVHQGYFTSHILPKALEGVACSYSGETYLPHPLVSAWMEWTIRKGLGDL